MLILESLLLSYFLYVVLYTVTFSFAGRFYKSKKLPFDPPHYKFCVLIPSYKEDAVIIDTAKRALNQSYPKEFYDVVVIADSLYHGTVKTLKQLPIKVVEVEFENSTKVKSLNKALSQLDDYDYAVILDADNVMAYDYLEKMNALFLTTGYHAVQGQRKPKNSETTLAYLDGISEAINNHIYRQGSTSLNMSSAINGSGVAFDFGLIKEKLARMNSVGGFDRELEIILLEENIKVYYFRDAVVLDEKVSKTQSFQKQRTRWISSQYFYLRKYFKKGMKALFTGDFTYFNSAILRNIQLPRLINIGLLTLTTGAFFLIRDHLTINYMVWPVLFLANTAAIFIAIPKKYYSSRMVYSLIKLPSIFLNMALLLFKMKGANRKFIHTPHEVKPIQAE